MLVSLNWIKDLVDVRLDAKSLAHRLTMSGLEVEAVTSHGDDTIFDVNVTPNRGDCLSVYGLAREIAAITSKDLKPFSKVQSQTAKKGKFIKVEIRDKKRCHRYAAAKISGIKIAPSPKWLSLRLEACGIRSINNVVDATNYLMLERGQPFHAFDASKLSSGKIVVKTAKSGEEFVSLDGISRKLNGDDLLICDGETPIALAGVMGGKNSEIDDSTTSIILECAAFDYATVRRTSKRLGLISESSRRFERGVDPNAVIENLLSLIELILQTAGGTAESGIVDVYPAKIKPLKLKLKADDVNSLLGTHISQNEIRSYLKSLGIIFSGSVCTVPTFRPDITRPVDLIEEVARLHGYDKIPVTLPKFEMSPISKPRSFELKRRSRDFFAANGFYEALNYGFGAPAELEMIGKGEFVSIANPLGVEFSAMKTTLLSGLINNLKHNINFGQESVRLFEIRSVFEKNDKGHSEPVKVSGVLYGLKSELTWSQKSEPVDFYDVKGVVEMFLRHLGVQGVSYADSCDAKFLHPQASAKLIINGNDAGHFGMVHPNIAVALELKKPLALFELDWHVISSAAGDKSVKYAPVGRFPVVRRDVALLLDNAVDHDAVIKCISSFKSKIVKEAAVFDIYRGKGIDAGKKSVAYAIFFSDSERTLTEEEISSAHKGLIEHLKAELKAEVR